MTGFFLLLAVLVVVAVLVLAVKAKPGANLGNEPWPFYAKKPLSVPEQVLYFRPVKAFPEHIVLAQVGLSRNSWSQEGKQLPVLEQSHQSNEC